MAAETDVDTFHQLLDRARAAADTDAERTLLADGPAPAPAGPVRRYLSR